MISEGTVQQVGPPLEIYEDPVNRFVASFIGESNFVEATIASANGEHVSYRIGSGALVQVKPVGQHRTGDRVALGLRPDKLSLAPASGEGKEGLVGQVRGAVYMGTGTSYCIALENDLELSVRNENSLYGEALFQIGDTVGLVIEPGAARMLVDRRDSRRT